ncbi:hypothetical protein AQUCO_03700183v1 [Aquilegia coerulea]|uniref:Uncharacterized protein n=1 Tax=Aquilegia coerulea TaxID=218851 RepID=A0A2G5CTZ5_AQUCA|nr:hypothetical protein AQUCO_03700183v1 [Aquilegia coerulea]
MSLSDDQTVCHIPAFVPFLFAACPLWIGILIMLVCAAVRYILCFIIAECQREMSEARAMVEEAERSLSLNSYGTGSTDGEIDKDRERLESVKAASVSAVVGTLAGIPISLSQVTSTEQLLFPLAITFISCALFGVTFRYTVRRDLDNIQLKTGTAAAFSVVKGLAALGAGPALELNRASFLSHAFDGALYVSESLLVFLFAAVGLDYFFKLNLLSPFPITPSR